MLLKNIMFSLYFLIVFIMKWFECKFSFIKNLMIIVRSIYESIKINLKRGILSEVLNENGEEKNGINVGT